VLADFVFMVDIWVQFHCAVWELIPGIAQHWELTDDLRTVRWMYFTGDFKWDILGQIPWHYSDCIVTSSPNGLKALRLLRVIKIFRLSRLNRRVSHMLRNNHTSVKIAITLIKLLMVLFLGAHWICCLWFFVGFPDGWITEQGLVDDNGELNESLYFAWISSFYWAVTTMTTIGYGDISAGTATERGIACIAMCLGCGLFAWTTGQITHTLTVNSQCMSRFNHQSEELDEFMECRGVSLDLRMQVKNYYQLKFPSERIFDEPAIMTSLPRELRYKMCLELYADMMQLAPLFMACDDKTQREICYRMRSYSCYEGNTIAVEGEAATHLYVLRLGSVRVTRKGEELAILERGEMFGENAIFSWSCDGKRTRTAVAMTLCDLIVLSVEDVEYLLDEHNSFYFGVRRIIDAHSARLRVVLTGGCPVVTADIYMIDWRGCGEKITTGNERLRAVSNKKKDVHALETELNRCPRSRGDEEGATNSRHKMVPHHLMQTHFRVLAVAMQTSLRRGDFPKGQNVSVEVSCKGMPGVPSSGVHVESHETEMIIRHDGHLTLNVSMDMDIYHESNNWEELGDVVISVLDRGVGLTTWESKHVLSLEGSASPREKEAQAALSAGASRNLTREASRAAFSSSFGSPRPREAQGSPALAPMKPLVEERTVLWRGTVTVAELVRHRVVDTSVRKVHPRMEITLQPHPDRQEKGVGVLQIVTRLKRVLRSDSVWRRLFTRIQSLAASKYFSRRRKEVAKRLHAKFHEKMDAKLLTRSVFKSFARGTDNDTLPFTERARQAHHASHHHGSHGHHHVHSSGHHHHSHTYVHAAGAPLEESTLVTKGSPVAASRSSSTSSVDAWKLDIETQLQDLKGILEQVLEQQRKHRHDVLALRSELQPMVQWSAANTGLGSELVVLGSDMREMARSQGAIMAVLQEQSQQQLQVMDAAQTLIARASATQPQPDAHAHADSVSQQPQRKPSLNAIEIAASPPEAHRMVADMSRVHKAVQRQSARSTPRSHTGNGDVVSARRWETSGEGESARRTPRAIAVPTVSNLQALAQLEEAAGAQHAQEYHPVETPEDSPRSRSNLGGTGARSEPGSKAGSFANSTPFMSYSKRRGSDVVDALRAARRTSDSSSAQVSPRTMTSAVNVSIRSPPVPRLPLTGSAWQQANAHAPPDTPRSNRDAAQERLPLRLELQRSRDEARDRADWVGALGGERETWTRAWTSPRHLLASARAAARSDNGAGVLPNFQNLRENIEVMTSPQSARSSSIAGQVREYI
jgi:CRP-like cAMP-binding protein